MQLCVVRVNLLNLHHGLFDRKLRGDTCRLLAVLLGFVDIVFPKLSNRTKQSHREPDTILCNVIFLQFKERLWQCNSGTDFRMLVESRLRK